MSATILLLSSDRDQDLRASLPAAVAQDDAEVVVIDNASSPEVGRLAREHGARHLRVERRLSWCAANNLGIAQTTGDPVLLLNADCFLDAGFLAAARVRLTDPDHDPGPDPDPGAGSGVGRVGAVAPRLLRTRGPDPSQRLDELDAAGMLLDRRRKNNLHGHGLPGERFAAAGEAFGADGAAALYRRAMLEDCAVDGRVLDEDLEKYAADVDLAWRAQLLGWRCAYEPTALAWHIRSYGPSTRARVPVLDRRQQFRNRYLMMLKNDTPRGLARDLHHVLAYELLALGHVLLRERSLLPAYLDALRLARRALAQRRQIQARRRARVPFGLVPAGGGRPSAPSGVVNRAHVRRDG